MQENIFNNDYRTLQAIKILSMYDAVPIIKSEEVDPGDEQSEERKRINKSLSECLPDMIEKGMISSVLADGYGVNEPLKFNKTGKELKEKLPSVISSLTTEKTSIEVQLGILKQAIGIEPTSIYTSYTVNGLSIKKYPWEMCDRKYNEMTKNYDPETEENILCGQYNSLASLWLNLSEDISCSQIIIANVEDGKKYVLSINQLVALNFN